MPNQFTKAVDEGRQIPSHVMKGKKWPKAMRPHTKETKELLRKNRVDYLTANPDKHPWKKNSKFISEPCELLKRKLREAGLDFIEEYQPLPKRFFALDISFPDRKVGIEVNGNQHYNPDKTLKKYYQDRHDLIVESGWTLIELPYIEVFRDDIVQEIKSKI
jgi:very-short-patch-repair endonuclease